MTEYIWFCGIISKKGKGGNKVATKRKKTNTKRKKTTRRNTKKTSYSYEITGSIFVLVGLIGLFRLGFIGRFFFALGELVVGSASYLLLLAGILLGGYLFVKRQAPTFFSKRLVGCYALVTALVIFLHIPLADHYREAGTILTSSAKQLISHLFHPAQSISTGGGIYGAAWTALGYFLIAKIGTICLALLFILIGISCITNIPVREQLGKIAGVGRFIGQKARSFFEKRRTNKRAKQAERAVKPEPIIEAEPISSERSEAVPPIISGFRPPTEERPAEKEPAAEEKEPELVSFEQESFENEIYQLPSIDLLAKAKPTDQSEEYAKIKENASKLEQTFDSFGVKAKITQIHLGPAVTKYEVQPAVGVKVSKIVSLGDDIALALAAKDIRIEAPIPGKSAIGIEVANQNVAMVSLREVLENNPQNKADEKLQIALGRDISGEAVMISLDKMPHLLVAGATGSGKSVCINGIITSILMRAKPHEVKMMMIDPKMVELNVYNGIPHLLAPVVTNPKKAAQALQKVVAEMERRYDLFSHTGTRNMQGYNEQVRRHNEENVEKQPELPYIVVIVDELADLMMVASNDVEDAITRLAQMARAAGIHLIIATQRPSVDVITGVIKANIPSRIAFAVSSAIDSRTILDTGGAEKLLGRGDMLLLPVGASKPTRVQGAFLSDQEVEDIVNYVVSQQKAQYNEEMIPDEIQDVEGEAEDELYQEAVELVVEMQTASVSMLQRRFRVGYNRAARLIDEMEARGVVGPHEGSKPRKVNIEAFPDNE